MKLPWNRMGGQLGLGLSVIGFFLIFLGWNGAASYDDVPAQFPYLVSGGIAGLAFVVLGAAFVVVDNQRRDRGQVQASIAELRDAVERLAAATASMAGAGNGRVRTVSGDDLESRGVVVAGTTTYHRTTCRLVEGKDDLPLLSVDEAESRGLRGCRTCGAEDLAMA